MNYSRFLTAVSKNRKPSPIRELTKIYQTAPPELIFLASGFPNPDLFPFKSASFELMDGTRLDMNNDLMKKSLQYGATGGYPALVKKLKSLTQKIHDPPRWPDTDLVVTAGGQDGLCKAIEMILNPRDFVIIQEPCYPGTLAMMSPYNPRYLPIKCDEDGMIPEALLEALKPWDAAEIQNAVEGVPKMIYIVPNASNPTGTSYTTERRRAIYEIASRYNLIILEDDPYYFVQFDDPKNYAPSFLNLDVDGRVIRFDSFSKILSSGIRLGYATGPKEMINRILLHMQCSLIHTAMLSQVLVSELLNKWDDSQFFEHTVNVQKFYKKQRDLILTAANKYLKDDCEWNVPTGGMFIWIKVPALKSTEEMIMKRGFEKNILLVPGNAFFCDREAPSNYMRAAFSVVSAEQIDQGMKTLSELVKEEIELNR